MYYACGEYGENFGRPHYHAIIFGLGFDDEEIIKKSWSLGFIKLGTVTYDSCRYVADYVQKRMSGPRQLGLREEPFALMSKGIGKKYMEANEVQLRDKLTTTIRGVKVGLPRYYRKKLEIPTEDLMRHAEERRKDVEQLHVERVGDSDEVFESVKRSRSQAELNAIARSAMRKKGRL